MHLLYRYKQFAMSPERKCSLPLHHH